MEEKDEEKDPLKNEVLTNLKNLQYKKVVILIGAGISVGAGIPDFRSPKIGYFDTYTDFNVPYPEAMFEDDYFQDNPLPLYKFVWGIIKLDP